MSEESFDQSLQRSWKEFTAYEASTPKSGENNILVQEPLKSPERKDVGEQKLPQSPETSINAGLRHLELSVSVEDESDFSVEGGIQNVPLMQALERSVMNA